MEKQTLTFTLERETKNTIRYAEDADGKPQLLVPFMFRSGCWEGTSQDTNHYHRRGDLMATMEQLYQISVDFLMQHMEERDSPFALEAYRRIGGELSIEEKRDVILFAKVRELLLRDYQDQATLQALWHRQTPIIAKVIWEMARDALQKASGIDINDDGLESLEVNEIRAALQNHL
jgi:hypothetical protein